MLLSTKAKQTSAIYQVREVMLKTGTTTVSNFKSKLRDRGNPQLRAMEGSVLEETFDSLIESLAHHGPVLARIKVTYPVVYMCEPWLHFGYCEAHLRECPMHNGNVAMTVELRLVVLYSTS